MEQETFWTLVKDLPHWEFELFLIFIFDILIGLIIWPLLQRFTKHHQDDDDKLEALEKRIEELEKR
jgi:hypothetical protein